MQGRRSLQCPRLYENVFDCHTGIFRVNITVSYFRLGQNWCKELSLCNRAKLVVQEASVNNQFAVLKVNPLTCNVENNNGSDQFVTWLTHIDYSKKFTILIIVSQDVQSQL